MGEWLQRLRFHERRAAAVPPLELVARPWITVRRTILGKVAVGKGYIDALRVASVVAFVVALVPQWSAINSPWHDTYPGSRKAEPHSRNNTGAKSLLISRLSVLRLPVL